VIAVATRKRNTTTTAPGPVVPTVLVTWIRHAPLAAMHPLLGRDPTSSGAGEIGGRRYGGRLGERVEIREDDAAILAAGGYVQYGPKAPSVEYPVV
jgi:hypothetical protein